MTFSSIEDYLYKDFGETSNSHGELGLIQVPSSRILEEGNLKLHLVNNDPINSLIITATPFNWMEVSLRYTDINIWPYSPYKSFSGNQTRKDKSFNLKIKLIEETERFPELSFGFRDFIGNGVFSSEYIVSSKKIGDFDFTVGLGWGSLSTIDGIENPLSNISSTFENRNFSFIGKGGNLGSTTWFRGPKVSSFYGVEYLEKRSGIRFKLDYDESNPFNLPKKSNFNIGLSIPTNNLLDLNLFSNRGSELGFGFSYKANYSKMIVPKNEVPPVINFNDADIELLKQNDDVFTGTINALLNSYGLFTQEIYLKENSLIIIIDNSKYRNLNTAAKRVMQLTEEVLSSREIKKLSIGFNSNEINTSLVTFPVDKFLKYLDYSYSYREFKRYIDYENFKSFDGHKKIFRGDIDFPIYSWGISPNLTNHIGSPETFYAGGLGVIFGQTVAFDKKSFMDIALNFNLYNNLDELRLTAYSRLPKVRSDIREYLKEGKNSISEFTFSRIFKPIYSNKGLLISGMKIGYLEQMYGGVGTEFLFRDINKPWYISGNFYWVKQREFNQRFSFRKYETFTGHLNLTWETPIDGVKLILSGGRYLAKDSGISLNLSKTFKSGFVLGAYATKTDVSAEEFGEGSFDKGIFFSIPLDIVSRKYRKGYAKFVWKNLTRDGGATLSGTLGLEGMIENTSSLMLEYLSNGFEE